MTAPPQVVGLAANLTTWLNQKFAEPDVLIGRDTMLFDGGLINSIRILEIIAWVERAIGQPIADRDIRMDNFASVDRIVAVFAPEASDVGV